MKKLLFLLLILSPLIATAAVDESKTDVYFANGVDTTEKQAWYSARKILKLAMRDEIFSGDTTKMDQQIGKFDLLYNETHGSIDFVEAALQKISTGNDLLDLTLANLFSLLGVQVNSIITREQQVVSVNESITKGHRVLVVAHSQGNLFISQVLDRLDDWMYEYVYTVRVASPDTNILYDFGNEAGFFWDNDVVGFLGNLRFGETFSPIRQINWVDLDPSNTTQQKPDVDYVEQSQVNQVLGGKYRAEIHPSPFDLGFNTHAFGFYMGEPLKADGETLINPFTNQPLSTNVGRNAIIGYIRDGLAALEQKPSQWKKVNDVGCLCSEKRITIAHKFDSNLDSNMAGQAVYAFDDEAKVYPVSGDHVFAPLGGSVLESGGVGDVCYV